MKTGLQSYMQFWEKMREEERIIADYLREIIIENLPVACNERITNVPNYYLNKRVCTIWPASVPRGGIKEGVLLGFCQGYLLKDKNNYLVHGTNKVIFYKIYKRIDDINSKEIIILLKESKELDKTFRKIIF